MPTSLRRSDFKGRYVKEADKDIIAAMKVYIVWFTDEMWVGGPEILVLSRF
jgi:hypothetical protein